MRFTYRTRSRAPWKFHDDGGPPAGRWYIWDEQRNKFRPMAEDVKPSDVVRMMEGFAC